MTLIELQKAAQSLSVGDRKKLVSYLNLITPDQDFVLSDELIAELDRRFEGYKKGTVQATPWREEFVALRKEHGL